MLNRVFKQGQMPPAIVIPRWRTVNERRSVSVYRFDLDQVIKECRCIAHFDKLGRTGDVHRALVELAPIAQRGNDHTFIHILGNFCDTFKHAGFLLIQVKMVLFSSRYNLASANRIFQQ